MEKVTYIIPIHEYSETIEKYLTNALNSLKNFKGVEKFKTLFVGHNDVLDKCEALYKSLEVQMKSEFVKTDITDIYEKINLGVTKCVTTYFSVLEFDDVFYPYWNDVAQKVISKNAYTVILPMNELMDSKGNVVGFMNEIAWDAAFTDELGFIAVEELKTYKDYNMTGAYIKTEDFISCGMLKPSMKIAAWYELMLRISNNNFKIYVAPRIGYQHLIDREGSYMNIIRDTITMEEGQWLINYALEDYVNKNDSKKVKETSLEKE